MITGNDTPPWVYGEDGVELPFTFSPEDEMMEMLTIEIDRKTKWKIKCAILKSAVKFFFARW